VERDLYLNLFMSPFLPQGVTSQRLVVEYGKGRGETLVSDREWISFPVQSADWSGNRLWTLTVAIGLPERHTILFHEISFSEKPRGRVVSRFES
jgi:hypothetical protein